jgi:hypothetical protein
MNTKTKGKLRLKKGIFKIRVGKFYDSHLATLYGDRILTPKRALVNEHDHEKYLTDE